MSMAASVGEGCIWSGRLVEKRQTQGVSNLLPGSVVLIERSCTSADACAVFHKSSARIQACENIESADPVIKISGLKQPHDECKNSFISGLRVVADMIGSWFNRRGMARVPRVTKSIDPDFSGEGFGWELGERIVLEVVDAYLSADQETLKV